MLAYYIDENGTRQVLEIPDQSINITESLNSSRTVAILKQQYEEQCKQNNRQFRISLVTTLISIGAFIVLTIALFLQIH